MCKSGATTGKVSIVDTDREFSIWSPLALIRVDPDVADPEFVHLVLGSPSVQRQVRALCSYGTQPNLAMAAMERLIVTLPSRADQTQLLAFLDRQLRPIELATNRALTQIVLVREYRVRLISDIVTGKLDVRRAARELPNGASPSDEQLAEVVA